MSKLIVKGKGSKNGPVKQGVPFGAMKPPQALASIVKRMSTALPLDRKAVRTLTASFYGKFMRKYPKASRSDFARQFDSTVPYHRTDKQGAIGYRSHRVFNAVENILRYADVTLKTKGKSPAKRKRAASPQREKIKTLQGHVNRAERVLMGLCFQLGLPRQLFAVAAARVGYVPTDVERLWSLKGALKDMGVAECVVAMRSGPMAGQPAMKAIVRQGPSAPSVTTASLAAGQPAESRTTTKPTAAGKAASIAPSAATTKAVRRNPAKRTERPSASA